LKIKGQAMNETHGAKIWVKGRVQGVGYRAFVEREAISLGLLGYCKNLADGRVEVVLEGGREGIDRLIKRLWEGPLLAKVMDMSIDWEARPMNFSGFSIEY
jgi:acylphosphatase